MHERNTMDRRRFLRHSATASAGLIVGPTAFNLLTGSGAVATTATSAAESLPFVDGYSTNVIANSTPETNAAVRILSGMQQIWKTGPSWDTGIPLLPDVLRANVRYCEAVTAARTDAEAKLAFIADRRHQSYSAILGLGPLTDLYLAGAKAVTGITSAPDGTPPAKINDDVPAGAPAGSTIGAGGVDSELGLVVQLSMQCAATSPPATPASTPTNTRVPGA